MALAASCGSWRPRMRAKRVPRSSRRPRLPGGLVRLFQRSRTAASSAASSKLGISIGSFTGEYFSIFLTEFFGIAAEEAVGQGGVDDHVSDDGGGAPARPDGG